MECKSIVFKNRQLVTFSIEKKSTCERRKVTFNREFFESVIIRIFETELCCRRERNIRIKWVFFSLSQKLSLIRTEKKRVGEILRNRTDSSFFFFKG